MRVNGRFAATLAGLACLIAGNAFAALTEGEPGRARPAVAPPERPRPTAKELYVGCYLLVRDTDVPMGDDGHFTNYSAANCGEQVLSTMTFREGALPGGKFRFCLPDTVSTRDKPAQVMAQAYLDFYDRKGARLPKDADGSAVFIVAMVDKWPCPAQGAAPTR